MSDTLKEAERLLATLEAAGGTLRRLDNSRGLTDSLLSDQRDTVDLAARDNNPTGPRVDTDRSSGPDNTSDIQTPSEEATASTEAPEPPAGLSTSDDSPEDADRSEVEPMLFAEFLTPAPAAQTTEEPTESVEPSAVEAALSAPQELDVAQEEPLFTDADTLDTADDATAEPAAEEPEPEEPEPEEPEPEEPEPEEPEPEEPEPEEPEPEEPEPEEPQELEEARRAPLFADTDTLDSTDSATAEPAVEPVTEPEAEQADPPQAAPQSAMKSSPPASNATSVQSKVSRQDTKTSSSAALPTSPPPLPPILDAAPPIRPKGVVMRRSPVPTAHPSLAKAAPPSLGQPRAVAPRIVDPNRPKLDVEFVASAAQVDADYPLEEPPVLTQASAPPARVPAARDQTTDERAVAMYFQQAREALNSGNLAQAIIAFSDVLDAQPKHLEARLARGRCRREQGDYSAALSDFHRAEDVAPLSAAPIFEMANLYFGRKSYDQAISLYSRAIGQDPEHAMAHCRRGISHHFRGHTERAESDLRTAMQLNPDIPNIQRYLKMAANGQGRR